MKKILFICWGNICRSPMAEFVMKDLVSRAGLADQFEIESAATSAEEVWGDRGNPVYPPARKKLAEHGIGVRGNELGVADKCARKTVRTDYGKYDMIIGMEQLNMRYMQRIYGGDPDGKLSLLLDYTDRPGDVADPWYTRDFDTTWDDIYEGCQGLLAYLTEKGEERI